LTETTPSRTQASALRDLARIVGELNVRVPPPTGHLRDATESRAIHGSALASVSPASTEEVSGVVRWCVRQGLAVVPRGGGTGYAAAAVPAGEAIVVCTDRLAGAGEVTPEAWRGTFPAGMTTSEVQRRCREAGLFFAPNPGSAESCFIGGNVATNAGGPRSFRYGQTRSWVTGLVVVLGDGRPVRLGGSARKNVETLDLVGLVCGSEGTLGVITEVTLRLQPAPEAELPLLALYADREAGLDALSSAMASGVVPAALEFLDGEALCAAAGTLPGGPAPDARFAVLAEALGSEATARFEASVLNEALAHGALSVRAPQVRRDVAALWRWRDGVSLAVTALRGGKLSEDITVPTERLGEALVAIDAIGLDAGVEVTSWGHAGDGNIHATVMVDHTNAAGLIAAEGAAHRFLEVPAKLGGAVSGEHGIGRVKLRAAATQLDRDVLAIQRAVKAVFDPSGMMNPWVKIPSGREGFAAGPGLTGGDPR
jgi:FAD/FMN-containing dehydrogenase